MKVSKRAKQDFYWYLSVRNHFSFSGSLPDVNIEYSKGGFNGLYAYYLYDTYGKKTIITKHPEILKTVLTVKASVNLHIKMYAEDRATGVLAKVELDTICEEFNTPNWFKEAIEAQKARILSKVR